MKSLKFRWIVLLALLVQTNALFCASPLKKSMAATATAGNALAFDGVNDFVNIGNGANVQLTQGTIEAWIKTPNAGSSWRGIVVKQWAYSLFMSNNELIAFSWDGSGNVSTGVYLNDNKWHHVALSFNNGVADGSSIFIDGVQNRTFTYNINHQGVGLGIGNGSASDNIQNFQGKIDEVRVWNTTKTEAEIQASMYSELAGNESGLVAYYNMNQGVVGGNNTAISTLTDATSNALHGTLENFSKTGATSNFVTSNAHTVEVIDPDAIRYIKFSGLVSADIPNIELRELMAYSGGENVAFAKTVSADSYGTDTQTSKIVDEDFVSGWVSNNYSAIVSNGEYGPTAAFPHYIIVDLGTAYNLDRLKLVLASFEYTFDFFVSQDNSTWSLVDSKVTTSGTFEYTNIPIQNVRYIKYACYYSSDWGQVNVQEIQAFSNNENVALNKSVYANSYEWGDAATNGKSAVDGSDGSRWSSNRNDHVPENASATAPVNVTLDLGSGKSIDSLALTYNSNTEFTLSVSGDGSSWTQIDQRLNTATNYSYVLRNSIAISHVIKSYTESSASCRVAITSDGGYAITERGMCWSTSPEPTVTNSKTTNGNGTGTFTAVLTNLIPNTIYYIRAYATNSVETKYSKEQTILFGLQVQTDVITDLTASTATSGGNIQAIDGLNVLARGVCWSVDPMPTIENSYTEDGSGTGEFSSSINGLSNNTKYYVRAYASTGSGTFYGEEYLIRYNAQSISSGSDGYYSGHVFTVTGTYNDKPYYTSQYGGSLYYEYGYWSIDDWITSEEAGDPPLTGWWDGTVLTVGGSPIPSVSCDKNSLKESSFNNGTFREQLTFTHDNANGAKFTGINTEDFMETGKAIVRNLPAGLTAKLIRKNNLELVLSITGNTTEHAPANNLSNVKIMLLPGAFTDGKTVLTTGNLKVLSLNYIEPTNISVTDTKSSTDFSITVDNNVLLQPNCVFNINNTTEINQLIINAGAKLNVTNAVTLNDVILKADDCNSFSIKLGTCMTLNGSLIYEKTMLDSKWYFLSFPCDVNVADISMIGGGVLDTDYFILTYDGAKRALNGPGANWSHITSGSLTAKKGYAFGLKTGIGNKTLSFELDKTIAECEIEASVPATFYDGSLGNNHKGWNLIGQPYLSSFSGCEVGLNYLVTWSGNSYVGKAKNLVSCIQPFEAFFVQVANSNPISFALSGRQSVRSVVEQDVQESIRLKLSGVAGSDVSTLIFDNEQSTEYQIGQDLEKWISTGSEKPQIYSLLNGIKYAYNALPLHDAINLPLAYYSETGGECTISAENIAVAGLTGLLLVDAQTGTTTDLMREPYNFNAEVGANENRFKILPQRISTDNKQDKETGKPVVTVRNSMLRISHLPLNSGVRIYDITGKLLHASDRNESDTIEFFLNAAGIHTVQIISTEGNHSYKVVNN